MIAALKDYFDFIQTNANGPPIIFIGAQKTRQRSLLHHGMPDPLITVSQNATVGFHGWLPFPEDKRESFSLSVDPNLNQKSSRTRLDQSLNH